MIGLVDGNNFFVSCERIFDLSLHNRPVGVLSNNDGCLISRSNELKALDIAMGTPYFQLKPLLQHHNILLKSSNYELYGDISRRIISVLYEFGPEVEQYSIDEAFIQIELPPPSDYEAFGKDLRAKILQWVGIPCGIGFAKTKTLAKIANHIGKKSPGGVFVMPDDPQQVLAKLPAAEIWGVGRKLAPKLAQYGIKTAGQLAAADGAWLRKTFNVCVARTALELNGVTALEEIDPEDAAQSVSCSRSFGHPVVELTDLTEAVAHYIAKAAEKLRDEKLLASGVNVYFEYYPEYAPQPIAGGYSACTVTFAVPTADTGAMLAKVTPKLKNIFIFGRRYKKAGVVFFGLESAVNRQLDLFAPSAQSDRNEKLSATVDAINHKFGKNAVFHLAEGIAKPWAMKREHLSGGYTTSWDQLLNVK